MSYLPQRRPRPGQQGGHLRRPKAIGDFFSDANAALGLQSGSGTAASVSQTIVSAECDAAGKAAQAPYDAKMADVSSSWAQRDGFYTPADLINVVKSGQALIAAAQDTLDKITVNYGIQNTAQQDIKKANNDALAFIVAWGIAKAKGATVIDAPGLKDWIIDVIGAAGEAAYRTAYLQCYLSTATMVLMPLLSALGTAASVFYNAVKAVVEVALKVGEIIYKTTVGTLDFVATVAKYAPWLAAAYGAAYLWKKHKRGG
jgi:hypothetical protein